MRNNVDLKTLVMTKDEIILRQQRKIDAINDKITVFETRNISEVKVRRLKKKRDHYLIQLKELQEQ